LLWAQTHAGAKRGTNDPHLDHRHPGHQGHEEETGVDMSTWLTIPVVAKRAGMSRSQMWRRLRALNAQCAGALLRPVSSSGRVGKWEVCEEVLHSLRVYSPETREEDVKAISGRVDELDLRLIALRGAHHGLRRRTEKELAAHKAQLEALLKLATAAEEVRKAFMGNE
jgi:hypothetical protein